MVQREQTRNIALILVLVFSVAFSLTLMSTIRAYNSAEAEVSELDSNYHYEILRLQASDGTPLKALLIANAMDYQKTDSSIPLVVICHGMSSNWWQQHTFAVTLVQRGYTVVLPEFRGHTSNPAPITLGSKEPWDILEIMDYLEENYNFVNITEAGILGESMGGLYATGAYYFESQGRGRLKALVNLCGPTNVSREIAFYTPNPDVVGDISFVNNVTGKNPVDFISPGELENVYIAHGTVDHIVDYECSVDLYKVLDPSGSRDDIVFESLEGYGHGLFTTAILQNTTAWLERYVRGVDVSPDDVDVVYAQYSTKPWESFRTNLLISSVLMIPIACLLVYLIKPTYFEPASHRNDKMMETSDDNALKSPTDAKSRLIYVGAYLGVNFVAGVVSLFFDEYIVSELMLASISSLLFVVFIYIKTTAELKSRAKKWLNWKSTLIFSAVISIGMIAYSVVTNLNGIENTLLFPGVRISWWIPYFTVTIAVQMVCNILFIRFLFADTLDQQYVLKFRLKEMIFNGLLMAGISLLFWFWGWSATFNIEMIGISLYLIPVTAFGMFIAFMIFDGISQIFETLTKSVVLGGIALGLIISMFVGASSLIFFY